MKMSQLNSCIDTLNKQYFFVKIGEQEGKTGPVWGWYQWEDVRKECRRVNRVKILCSHVCKWKNETSGNYFRNGEG
jgi:hypothetical protein